MQKNVLYSVSIFGSALSSMLITRILHLPTALARARCPRTRSCASARSRRSWPRRRPTARRRACASRSSCRACRAPSRAFKARPGSCESGGQVARPPWVLQVLVMHLVEPSTSTGSRSSSIGKSAEVYSARVAWLAKVVTEIVAGSLLCYMVRLRFRRATVCCWRVFTGHAG